jgi:hypothetical protein
VVALVTTSHGSPAPAATAAAAAVSRVIAASSGPGSAGGSSVMSGTTTGTSPRDRAAPATRSPHAPPRGTSTIVPRCDGPSSGVVVGAAALVCVELRVSSVVPALLGRGGQPGAGGVPGVRFVGSGTARRGQVGEFGSAVLEEFVGDPAGDGQCFVEAVLCGTVEHRRV